jgi:hypothetical protein
LVSRVEAGSNTSTVTLRVVGGNEKGSLKTERVKYGRESQGTRTQERLRWPAAYTKDRPVLSSERVPHTKKNGCELVARVFSRKRATVQRGLDHGSRGIAIVRSRYQASNSEDPTDWKRLSVCDSDL